MRQSIFESAFIKIVIVFSLAPISGVMGQNKNDSLLHALTTAKDTERVLILTELSGVLLNDNPDSSYQLALTAMNEAKALHYRKGIIKSYNAMVSYLDSRGFVDNALALADELIDTLIHAGDTFKLTEAYIDHGNILQKKGDFENATAYYFKALHLLETLDNNYGVSSVYRNMSIMQISLGDYRKGRSYALKAIRTIPDSSGLPEKNKWLMFKAASYNTLGSMYIGLENWDSAMYCFHITKGLYDQLPGSYSDLANLYNNIAILNFYTDKKSASLASFREALYYRIKSHSKNKIAQSLNNIASFYSEINNYDSCRYYALKSLSTAKEANSPSEMIDACQTLYTMYEDMDDYPNAFAYYKRYTTLKDSVAGEESRQRISEMETVYESEKKAKEIKLLQQENQLNLLNMQKQQVELKRQRWLTASGVIALLAVMIIALLIFNRYRLKKRSNKVLAEAYQKLEETNEIIVEKNKDITDSLKYARHIQRAVLPSRERLNNCLENALFFRPKGIVSGDFYYLNELDNGFIIAVADCTGHGVPGAMVSVLCFNALNHGIRDCGLRQPAQILEKCRDLIIQTFEMSTREMREGMDIAMCHISYRDEVPIIQYAGANNPLYVLPKNTTEFTAVNPDYEIGDGQLIEIRPDKQPIGKYANHKSFHDRQLVLTKGDSVFLFSDGYADQFGGPQGKKFKYRRLKELIVRTSEEDMPDIEKKFASTFDDWKGRLEQIDDVCVLGLRL